MNKINEINNVLYRIEIKSSSHVPGLYGVKGDEYYRSIMVCTADVYDVCANTMVFHDVVFSYHYIPEHKEILLQHLIDDNDNLYSSAELDIIHGLFCSGLTMVDISDDVQEQIKEAIKRVNSNITARSFIS